MPRSKIRRYLRHGMLPQLAVFESVARLGSFTRAAEELFMSQPTVSIHIKKLTETLDLPLLDQSGKKIRLTEAGHELKAACEDIFARLALTEDRLSSLSGVDRGRLRIAASTASKAFVARLLATFCARHPKVEVALHVDNWQGIHRRLHDQIDDLYVLSSPPPECDLVAYPILPNPIEIFAAADHPLVGKPAVAFEQLADEPFILREPGSATRKLAERLFEQHAVTPHIRMEVTNDESIKHAVLSGLGIAVMPRCTVEADASCRDLRALDVQGLPVMQQWFIAHRRLRQLPQVASAFLDHARANATKGLDGQSETNRRAQAQT